VRKAEQKPSIRRGRFILLVGVMSLLGFVTVYAGDAALGSFAQLEEQGTSLWDKLVDRMLDRDIPRAGAPAKKKPTPPKKVAKPAPKKAVAPPKVVHKVESLPQVPVPDTPRAELPPPAPEAYRKVAPPAAAPRLPQNPRARIDAILDRVGIK